MGWKKSNRWAPYRRRDEIARFMEKVYVDKKTGCWYWTASRSSYGGYGMFYLRAAGKSVGAHIASFVLFKNKGRLLPKGVVVRHKCDSPPCVNPKHLLRGTPKQNTQDMIRRGRHAHGLANNCATVTEELVSSIKSEYVNRFGELSRLSRKHGLPLSTVDAIIKGRTWKHVPWGARKFGRFKKHPPLPHTLHGNRHHKAKMTADDVREVLEGVLAGIRPVEYARKFKVSRFTIGDIIHGRSWRQVYEAFHTGTPRVIEVATRVGRFRDDREFKRGRAAKIRKAVREGRYDHRPSA